MSALRVGVVGAGSMGSLHARVVATHAATKLAWVYDPDSAAGQRLADRFSSTYTASPDWSDVDAVVVAAPTEHHHAVALEIIDAGVPLLLEKPLATTYAESLAIVDAAAARGSVLCCGLLERFNPAVRTATEIARDPVRVATVRHSPYSPRIRTGVAADLLIHDADIALRIIGAEPTSVVAQFGHFAHGHPSEDVADALLKFPEGQVASLSASRISQQKVRTLTITESERLIDVDLLRQAITIYRNVVAGQFDEMAGYSQQTVIDIPVVRHTGEPLALQLDHFVALVEGRADAAAELGTLLAPHRAVDAIVASGSAA